MAKGRKNQILFSTYMNVYITTVEGCYVAYEKGI